MKKILNKIITFFKKIKIKFKKKQKKIVKSVILPKDSIIIDNGEKTPLDVELIDKNTSKKNKKKLRQYTKKIVDILTIMSCIWITWSYILSTIAVIRFQDVQVLSSLSEEVCRTILGVVIAYSLKSFCESFAEAKQHLKDEEFYNNIKNHDNIDLNNSNDSDEVVG